MMNILQLILTILLPPLGVFMQVGLTFHFWLNVLLTILGWVPGVIHGLWLMFSAPSPGPTRI